LDWRFGRARDCRVQDGYEKRYESVSLHTLSLLFHREYAQEAPQ